MNEGTGAAAGESATPRADDEAVSDTAGEQVRTPSGESRWVFMVDPEWRPDPSAEPAEEPTGGSEAPDEDEAASPQPDLPPITSVVGGWLVDTDGTSGAFQPNPVYEPLRPGSPTDPVDATLQLVLAKELEADELLSVMRTSRYTVAMDGNTPMVTLAPDGVPSVVVTTAPLHQARIDAPRWQDMSSAELASLIRNAGVDLLLNPGAVASMRLIGDVFVSAVDSPPAQVDVDDPVTADDMGEALASR